MLQRLLHFYAWIKDCLRCSRSYLHEELADKRVFGDFVGVEF